ncbi:MAG: hypothetical protein CMJ75_22815 [Planctomycetaceae bacterium]|nr:hypothetical protein [Planctomycetaceae bacterium]
MVKIRFNDEPTEIYEDCFALPASEAPLPASDLQRILCYEPTSEDWDSADLEAYTTQIGSMGIPFSFGRVKIEKNPALVLARGLGSDVGAMWELASSMGIAAQALYDPIASICSSPWRLEASPLPEVYDYEHARRVRAKQYRYCQHVWAEWTRRGQDGLGLVGYFLDVLRFSLICGFYLGELTGHFRSLNLTGQAGRYLLPAIPKLRTPWSVDRWVYYRNPDNMIGVKQRAYQQIDSRGETGGWDFIPWSKLVHVPFLPISGNPDGTSLLRSSWAPLRMLQKYLQIGALSAEVNGVGYIWVEQDPQNPLTEADKQTLVTQLKNYQGSQIPYSILPPGAHKIQWITPGSTVANFSSQISDCERQISLGTNTAHKQIGLQNHGSFAARKQAGAEAQAGWQFLARTLAAHSVEVVLNKFLRLNFPGDSAQGLIFVPRVTDLAIEVRDQQSFSSTLQGLTSAGLISPTPEIESALLAALGLPQGSTTE